MQMTSLSLSSRSRAVHPARFSSCRVATVLALLLAAGAPGTIEAQSAETPILTRRIIEQRVAAAEAAAAQTGDGGERSRYQEQAQALRERLRFGDFLPGDRMLVSVTRGTPPTDTVVVAVDTTITLAGLPPMSVRGVLRSELAAYIESQLGTFVREPVVTTVPLLRVGVFGGVRAGGYFEIPADSRLSDLLMRAGGPSETADPRKMTLRRGTQEVLDAHALSEALRLGRSLDELGVKGGDDVMVKTRRQMNWGQALQWASVIVSVVTVIGVSR
jgi:hypothetical protein